jgi:hypothetical protein
MSTKQQNYTMQTMYILVSDGVVMMVNNTRNLWVSGRCLKIGFVFENWICFHLQVKGGKKTPTKLGPLETANLNHWTTAV